MPVGVSRSMGEVKHYLGEFQAVLFRVQQLHGLLQLACEPTARTGPAKMAGTCSALLFWQLYLKVRRERTWTFLLCGCRLTWNLLVQLDVSVEAAIAWLQE